jgi:hypothetical protein
MGLRRVKNSAKLAKLNSKLKGSKIAWRARARGAAAGMVDEDVSLRVEDDDGSLKAEDTST